MQPDEVLFTNEAFYLAFSEGDLAAMDHLWADRDEVVCIHPGWPALTDRETVMASWARILGSPAQPRVDVHVQRTISAGSAVVVVCYEQMDDTVLAATNVFEPGDGGPRMVAHHAGLCRQPPDFAPKPPAAFDA